MLSVNAVTNTLTHKQAHTYTHRMSSILGSIYLLETVAAASMRSAGKKANQIPHQMHSAPQLQQFMPQQQSFNLMSMPSGYGQPNNPMQQNNPMLNQQQQFRTPNISQFGNNGECDFITLVG